MTYSAKQVSRMLDGEALFNIFKNDKFTGTSVSASSDNQAVKRYKTFVGR